MEALISMDDYSSIVSAARRMREGGQEIESVLAFLRSSGFSIIDAIKAIREIEVCSLGIAKDIVHHSAAWTDMTAGQEELGAALLE